MPTRDCESASTLSHGKAVCSISENLLGPAYALARKVTSGILNHILVPGCIFCKELTFRIRYQKANVGPRLPEIKSGFPNSGPENIHGSGGQNM